MSEQEEGMVNERPAILYVHVLKTKEAELCNKLSQVMSYNNAKNLSYKWYQEYMEMLVNVDSGELIMYKKRTVGYWEANQRELDQLS